MIFEKKNDLQRWAQEGNPADLALGLAHFTGYVQIFFFPCSKILKTI